MWISIDFCNFGLPASYTQTYLHCDVYLVTIIVLIIIREGGEGHLKVVEFLVKGNHCDPDAKDKNECTPLHYAVRWGHNDKCSVPNIHAGLVSPMYVLWVSFKILPWTPKYHIYYSHIVLLIDANVKFLTRFDHLKTVEVLVGGEHCDLNCKDKDGETPLHCALK